MKPEYWIVLAVYVAFTLLEIVRTGYFRKQKEEAGDKVVDAVSAAFYLALQPVILLVAGFIAALAAPEAEGALSHWPILAQIGLLLIFDDMAQYWWHRTSHTVPWLYKLHRPHHNAGYMSIRMVYRNNFFYFLLFPSFWFSGVLIYLGLGYVYAAYMVVKAAVIFGAHSDVRWDEPLYKIKWLSPVMWLVERTISTPATHSAHHGQFASDPATNYKGNYGNLLFFWDVLFGTAKITRRYPDHVGVENLPETSVGEQLLWPLVVHEEKQNKIQHVTT